MSHKLRISDWEKKNPLIDGELEFMIAVWLDWESRGGCIQCAECKIGLPNFHPAFVAHVYGKGTEPQMRLDTENVIPLCLTCHDIFDKKLRSEMIIWYKIEKLMEYLKQKYKDPGRTMKTV